MASQPIPASLASRSLDTLKAWLVPGLGHLPLDPLYRRRGLWYGGLIHLTFLIGICMHGGVVWPNWNPQDPTFNVVNNLTFVVQMFAGWPALISLGSLFAGFAPLKAVEPHAWFELGSFYCLVAGALNYFVICNAADLRRKKAAASAAVKQEKASS
jgi:hypothetical protein